MKCAACGNTLSPDNRFCPACGATVPPPNDAQSPAAGASTAHASVRTFRDTLTEFADKLVARTKSGEANAPNRILKALGRIIQGALMHRDIYTRVARQKELTGEACWIVLALTLASALGVTWGIGFLGGINFEWLALSAAVRFASLACGILALQFFAKAIHHIDISPLGWFRAVIYAQAATILTILGSIGLLSWLWAAACIVVAICDLTRKSITDAVILLVIAWAAYSIGGSLMAKLLSASRLL